MHLSHLTPAIALGLPACGQLRVGTPADLVLFSADFRVLQTWIDGVKVVDG